MSGKGTRPPWVDATLRWGLVVVIGASGSWGANALMNRQRAGAAVRVLSKDFAQFEGCMFGPVALPDEALTSQAIAYARGTGDPLWPHTCSRALTRVASDSTAISADNQQYQSLSHAASAMESALGEAVFWTNSIRARQARAASWIHEYIELRREVRAWMTARGASIPRPEQPPNPRIPRSANEPDPPPPPQALFGGIEADIVDAVITPTHFAWIFRDRRSQYTQCSTRWQVHGEPSAIECARLTVGTGGDPRDLTFVPSMAAPILLSSTRPPSDERVALTVPALQSVLTVRGMTQAPRDFFSHRDGVVWGVHRERFSLALRSSNPMSERVLQANADVLATDRAFGSDGEKIFFAWLTVAHAGTAALHALAVESAAQDSVPLMGRWSSYDRAIYPCTEGSQAKTRWLVSDGTSQTIGFSHSDRGFAVGFRTPVALTRHALASCSVHRTAFVATADAHTGEATLCDDRNAAEPCRPTGWSMAQGSSFAVTDDAFIGVTPSAAGETGPFTARIAIANAATPAITVRPIAAEPAIPAAHATRVLASDDRVLILTRATQTHAFRLQLSTQSITPMAVAEPPTER